MRMMLHADLLETVTAGDGGSLVVYLIGGRLFRQPGFIAAMIDLGAASTRRPNQWMYARYGASPTVGTMRRVQKVRLALWEEDREAAEAAHEIHDPSTPDGREALRLAIQRAQKNAETQCLRGQFGAT